LLSDEGYTFMAFSPIISLMNLHFRRIMIITCFFTLFLFSLPLIWAQEKDLPSQFRQISLGMSLDELKSALEEDKMFNFRGDRDVSFLPAREESLVETSGSSFVKRAFFQLRDGALFIMAYTLNTNMMDHYSVFTDLVEKYGPPTYLDPKEAVWETEALRVSIERPLTVKYIDKKVFDDIISESALVESKRVQQRQEFLNEF